MAISQADVVFPEELELFVQSLRCFPVAEVGSTRWLDSHELIIKLSQQATLEAKTSREETVKEFLILYEKLKVLVHEAFCVMVWKIKVLPTLISIEPNPPAGFLIYTVLFHEGSAISLLETALFHQDGCQSLHEAAVDLVDYCAHSIAQLIGLVSMGYHENETKIDVDESTLSELERQKRDLLYKIGIRCLSILNYLADSIEKIPLSAAKRMVTVHDIPCLLSEVLHFKPWFRKTTRGFEKLIDEKWVVVKGDQLTKVTKPEAQTWFCFKLLLFHHITRSSYKINDFRQKQLAKCPILLNEAVLDQLPLLAEFKHFLCTITIDSSAASDHNLILELVPEIKEGIMKEAEQVGFHKIATEQAKIFLTPNREEIFTLAKRLNVAYNTDFLAEFEQDAAPEVPVEKPEKHKCANCAKDAIKRCSNCMIVYYCSRECQVANWPTHKEHCLTSVD